MTKDMDKIIDEGKDIYERIKKSVDTQELFDRTFEYLSAPYCNHLAMHQLETFSNYLLESSFNLSKTPESLEGFNYLFEEIESDVSINIVQKIKNVNLASPLLEGYLESILRIKNFKFEESESLNNIIEHCVVPKIEENLNKDLNRIIFFDDKIYLAPNSLDFSQYLLDADEANKYNDRFKEELENIKCLSFNIPKDFERKTGLSTFEYFSGKINKALFEHNLYEKFDNGIIFEDTKEYTLTKVSKNACTIYPAKLENYKNNFIQFGKKSNLFAVKVKDVNIDMYCGSVKCGIEDNSFDVGPVNFKNEKIKISPIKNFAASINIKENKEFDKIFSGFDNIDKNIINDLGYTVVLLNSHGSILDSNKNVHIKEDFQALAVEIEELFTGMPSLNLKENKEMLEILQDRIPSLKEKAILYSLEKDEHTMRKMEKDIYKDLNVLGIELKNELERNSINLKFRELNENAIEITK